MTPLNVVALQPFDGGSHRQFLSGWIGASQHNWSRRALPARHWKWRMRQAAPEFAHQLARPEVARPDLIVTTDLLDVATFRGLLARLRPEFTDLPIVAYFHENQFAYPTRFEEGSPQAVRDEHFAFTNLTTVLAADAVWFNSEFNRQSLAQAFARQQRRWPDRIPDDRIQSQLGAALIQPPGIDASLVDPVSANDDRVARARQGAPLRLLWAARWEHDKGPERLRNTLTRLTERGVPFELNLIGESYAEVPPAIRAIEQQFAQQLKASGFQPTRADYWQVLAESDLLLSTAHHEFFGCAAAEAIAAGCRPLLPWDLAYPELIQRLAEAGDHRSAGEYTYPVDRDEEEVADEIAERIQQVVALREESPAAWSLPTTAVQEFGRALSWSQRATELDLALDSVHTAASDRLHG